MSRSIHMPKFNELLYDCDSWITAVYWSTTVCDLFFQKTNSLLKLIFIFFFNKVGIAFSYCEIKELGILNYRLLEIRRVSFK